MPVASGSCPKCGQAYLLGWRGKAYICAYCAFGLALEPAAPSVMDADAEPVRPPSSAFQIGSYLVLEEIGRGAMGVIYRAVHRETQEIVAIKTVLPEDDGTPEILERFRREALAARRLDHPHSMRIYEVGCSASGVPYFSMELAEGGSLHDLGAKYRGRWRQIAELMVKISNAVEQAHELGLIHRDLKPGNILFNRDYEPLVTDYGLVKELVDSKRLTHSHAMLGTPSYTAPEQAAGRTREVTASADIYSLGAILFELLTGRPPFVGDNVLDVLQQVTQRSPVRPRSLAPSIPKPLEHICMRCLERDPSDRYASARDFADDLENWLRGKQISSPSLHTRFLRKVRRHLLPYGWVAGLACIALVLSVAELLFNATRFDAVPATSLAIAFDNLSQDAPLEVVARQLTIGLRSKLSKRRAFKLLGESPIYRQPSTSVFDPLIYGRKSNAQLILTGVVRRRQAQLQITSRLLRCDTGDVVWLRTDLIPYAQSANSFENFTSALAAVLEEKMRIAPSTLPLPHVPRPEALAFYNKALELSVHKNPRDMKAAASLFRRACECEPHYVQARSMLALALLSEATMYGETDLLPSAITTAEDALKEDPDSPQAHRVMGGCYYRQARYEEALDELWRGVELDPQAPGCVQALGVCLRDMGQPELALPWLTRATRLAPSRGAFATSLGETLALCSRDDDADRALKHASELDQDRPDALIAISALRVWQKSFVEARTLCNDVRRRFPESRNAAAVAAWSALCEGSLEDAKVQYKVLRNEHSYQTTWDCFGAVNPSSALAYIAKQENLLPLSRVLAQEAIDIDQNLLASNPKNLRVIHDLAATFAVVGDFGQAQSFLDKALLAGWIEYRSTAIDPRLFPLTKTKRFENAAASVPATLVAHFQTP